MKPIGSLVRAQITTVLIVIALRNIKSKNHQHLKYRKKVLMMSRKSKPAMIMLRMGMRKIITTMRRTKRLNF